MSPYLCEKKCLCNVFSINRTFYTRHMIVVLYYGTMLVICASHQSYIRKLVISFPDDNLSKCQLYYSVADYYDIVLVVCVSVSLLYVRPSVFSSLDGDV